MMLACLLMVGCQEEEKWGTMATSGFRISLQDAAVGVETKSTPEELGEPLKTNFEIKVVKQSTGESKTYKYEDNLVIPASVGTYDIIASYGDNPVLEWDKPYYEGTAENQEIKEDATEPVPVKIDCKVANALASVEFLTSDTEMKKKYDDYALKVKVGTQSVELKSTEKRSAYFQDGAEVSLSFVYTTKGGTGKEEQEFRDGKFTAEKGKHYIIKLKMADDASMKIEKKEVEEVTINETIPMEWLPAPSVSASGFDPETKTLDVYETAAQKDASIDFSVNQIEGLEDLEFTLNFQDEAFTDLNGTYTLSSMDEAAKAKFADAGITLPTISQTSPKLQFSSEFLSTLKAKNEGNVVNTITINKVIANGRDNKEGEQTYTINTHKPEFTVEVLPGNVWSKTFTAEEITVAEGKGDLETIKKNLVYQYQDTDGSWKDFSDQTKREQAFAEHPEKLSYRVRSIYRGEITSLSEKEITLESQQQLENSNMENWYRADTDWDFPNYIPRNSSGEAEYWDTNNEFTFRYDIPWPKDWYDSAFNGFPAVSYSTENKHGGDRAAELRNTAAGPVGSDGNVYDNNRVAGMLFYGNYTGTTSTSTANGSISIDEGRSFSNRPTQLKFYYTYEPCGTDTYEVIVKVFDSENNVIGSGNYTSNTPKTSWDENSVDIVYSENGCINKAAKIYVLFQSSNAGQGKVPYERKGVILADYGLATTYSGSVLRIDDISLVYDK